MGAYPFLTREDVSPSKTLRDLRLVIFMSSIMHDFSVFCLSVCLSFPFVDIYPDEDVLMAEWLRYAKI